jgi:hypothetical protein
MAREGGPSTTSLAGIGKDVDGLAKPTAVRFGFGGRSAWR